MKVKSLFRMPLVHFLVIGTVLYAGQRLLPEDYFSPPEPIVISAADVQLARRQLRTEILREPTQAEIDATLRRRVDEEILLREALKLGLENTDKVARQRLIKNMRFAFPESKEDDESLLRTAQRLGMAERDSVVRLRLVQTMEKRLASSVTLTDAEMRDYLEKHPERYGAAARYSFKQVFLSADVPASDARAMSVLAALRAGDASAAAKGDVFLLGSEFKGLSLDDISKLLGDTLAQAVRDATVEKWSAPVKSAYGVHLILLEKIAPAEGADFAKLRSRLAYALLAEKEQRAVREALPALRARYRVESVSMNGVAP